MRIKATIVACAFSVQYFENATIVAYAGFLNEFLIWCFSEYWQVRTRQVFAHNV